MPYTESLMRLQESLLEARLSHDFLFIKGESLVQRARNSTIRSFLKTDFERMIFIDADIEFIPEDIEKLYNLDKPVCCGTYPMKKTGIKSSAWKDGKLVNINKLKGPTEIDYAATGFLMVKRFVFEQMKEFYPEKAHMELDGSEKVTESFAWFDPRVSKGETTEERTYLPEDYAFSLDVRNMGGTIILDPSIKLGHYGTYRFGE